LGVKTRSMDLRYKIKTAPLFSPVTIAELKRNLRIPTTDIDADRDALLFDLITAAVEKGQELTGRQFARATYTLYLDEYPVGDEVAIDLGPVAAITTVKYYAPGANTLTTVTSTKYQLDNSELTARLRFLESFSSDADKFNTVEIEFTNGWATAADIPANIKAAIILFATEAYLNAGNDPLNFGFGKKFTAADRLLTNYKIMRY
jgi:uncharacterized phiE125 gp8 family phage protein